MKFTVLWGIVACGMTVMVSTPGFAQQKQAEKAKIEVMEDGALALPIDLVFCVDASGWTLTRGQDDAENFIAENITRFAQYSSPGNLQVGRVMYRAKEVDEEGKKHGVVCDVTQFGEQWDSISELGELDPHVPRTHEIDKVIKTAIEEMEWRQDSYKVLYLLGADPNITGYREGLGAAKAKGIRVNPVFFGHVGHSIALRGIRLAPRSLIPGLPLRSPEIPNLRRYVELGDNSPAFPEVEKWRQMAVIGQGHLFFLDIHRSEQQTISARKMGNAATAMREQEKARLKILNQTFHNQFKECYFEFSNTYIPYGRDVLQRRGYLAMHTVNLCLNGFLPDEKIDVDLEPAAPILSGMETDNGAWDLVDLARRGPVAWEQIDDETLPPVMQEMNEAEKMDHLASLYTRRAEVLEKALILSRTWAKELGESR